MVQPDAVLEVAYGVLDLGVAAVIGLQLQGFSVPVGDEAVIAVGGEEGQLGTGRRLPYDRLTDTPTYAARMYKVQLYIQKKALPNGAPPELELRLTTG